MSLAPLPGHSAPTPLALRIADLVRAEGPISVERYMALALGDPEHGYYTTRDPLGRVGSFVTAPEISQMFGELVGLWCLAVWSTMGEPSPIRLVELGPGRGTLMRDALRAARLRPAFLAAADVHLVETSPVLRARQREALAGILPGSPSWHTMPETLPEGPALIVANEFFDALPIRQFQSTPRGWCERHVGLDADGGLAFGLSPDPDPGIARLPAALAAPEGAIAEVAPAAVALAAALARRLAVQGGALLAIDYGSMRPAHGDSLQAVKAHRFVDPLSEPGEADLTTHVDFSALARAALANRAAVHGPVTQGAFLIELGLRQRAATLRRDAGPEARAGIDADEARLIGEEQGEMGGLFKVMAITDALLPPLPGFAGLVTRPGA